jgi:DNA-binding NtrC family response regulator
MCERRVLVVDDELAIRAALQANFRRVGWTVECASGVGEAIAKFRAERFPVVITDIRMPDGDGLQVMHAVRKMAAGTAVILLTAYGSVPDAVEGMKGGASDYLVKPVSFEHLMAAVERVLERSIAISDRNAAPEIIGNSAALTEVLAGARQAAQTDADILVEAESGTGKELLARLIHNASQRRDRPFVAVNCAAVPENLLESELFGHVRGAFTGAVVSKIGKFEQAQGGTLLLDEVGEMPLGLQPKLLRVLQEREIERLGDARTTKVDIRIIATTNRSLRAMVEEGKFRSDLYYRLNVIPLTLPPLRERKEDIALLAKHFAKKYSKPDRPITQLSPVFLAGLELYPWPGNVRELANFIHRVMALCVTPEVGKEFLEPLVGGCAEDHKDDSELKPGISLREIEKRLLEVTLTATDGNRTRAAEMLGISIRTIRNKIRDYGLPKRSYA